MSEENVVRGILARRLRRHVAPPVAGKRRPMTPVEPQEYQRVKRCVAAPLPVETDFEAPRDRRLRLARKRHSRHKATAAKETAFRSMLADWIGLEPIPRWIQRALKRRGMA